MIYYYFVPFGAIFFILLGLILWRRQRQRDQTTVYVPPQNYVIPIQPANFNSVNSQYGMPMSNAQTTPSQYPYQVANPIPPTPQQFSPTPQQFSPAPQPIYSGSGYTPSPHWQPSPITVPPTTLPNPVTSSSDNSDLYRMQQVQRLVIEVHRLESESREGNRQRVQELKQRIGELSSTEGRMTVPDPLQSPPVYDVKQGI